LDLTFEEKQRDACQLFWIVKGHMPQTLHRPDVVDDIYDAYSKRVWHWDPNEVFHRKEGWEEAYADFLRSKK